MDNQVMSLKDWIITLILLCIPCLNIVMLIIWATGNGGASETKVNFARAQLIIMAALIVLSFLGSLIFGASLAGIMSSAGYYY